MLARDETQVFPVADRDPTELGVPPLERIAERAQAAELPVECFTEVGEVRVKLHEGGPSFVELLAQARVSTERVRERMRVGLGAVLEIDPAAEEERTHLLDERLGGSGLLREPRDRFLECDLPRRHGTDVR